MPAPPNPAALIGPLLQKLFAGNPQQPDPTGGAPGVQPGQPMQPPPAQPAPSQDYQQGQRDAVEALIRQAGAKRLGMKQPPPTQGGSPPAGHQQMPVANPFMKLFASLMSKVHP